MRGANWARGPHVGWGFGLTETRKRPPFGGLFLCSLCRPGTMKDPGPPKRPGVGSPLSESAFNQPSTERPARGFVE
jgi:hypothetical protein